jgi:hypothetical protein
MSEEEDEYSTNWHLYGEADALFRSAETLVSKLTTKTAKEHGKKCLQYLGWLRRLCDQHAG